VLAALARSVRRPVKPGVVALDVAERAHVPTRET
jgi:hypothetical protein